jgi:chaperonin GroES
MNNIVSNIGVYDDMPKTDKGGLSGRGGLGGPEPTPTPKTPARAPSPRHAQNRRASGATAAPHGHGGFQRLRPLHDRVLVRRDPPESSSAGGIVIPEVGKVQALTGTVVAAGPGRKDDSGVFHETQVRPGDRVVFNGSVNVNYPDLVKDGDLVMMAEADILGVIG